MTAYSKELIIFDMDGTLTPSRFPVDAEMGGLIMQLLSKKKVAIISGSGFSEFQTDILKALPQDSENLSNLILLPTSGGRLYVWKGTWCEEYSEHLSPAQKEKIMTALNAALRGSGYVAPEKTYGPVIQDRGSQITFSANGQNAPLEIKTAWDPTRAKREKIVELLKTSLPEFEAMIGGTNTIDITRRGVNKSFAIRKLEEYLKMPLDHMLFVGDKLMPGGNDFPARATGIDCIQVADPEETKKLIRSWVE